MHHAFVPDGRGRFSRMDMAFNQRVSGLDVLRAEAGKILLTDARWRPPFPRPSVQMAQDFDKRGYPGDTLEQHELGTLLWTLKHMPLNDTTLPLANRAVVEGFSHWVDQGIVRATRGVTPLIERHPNQLRIQIQFWRQDDTSLFERPFEHLWTHS